MVYEQTDAACSISNIQQTLWPRLCKNQEVGTWQDEFFAKQTGKIKFLNDVAKNYFKNIEKIIRKKICLNDLLKRKHSNSKSVDKNLFNPNGRKLSSWLVADCRTDGMHCLKLVFFLEDDNTASTTSRQRMKKEELLTFD